MPHFICKVGTAILIGLLKVWRIPCTWGTEVTWLIVNGVTNKQHYYICKDWDGCDMEWKEKMETRDTEQRIWSIWWLTGNKVWSQGPVSTWLIQHALDWGCRLQGSRHQYTNDRGSTEVRGHTEEEERDSITELLYNQLRSRGVWCELVSNVTYDDVGFQPIFLKCGFSWQLNVC